MGLQHRHSPRPHTRRHHPRREMGSGANMVPRCHRLHHRRHRPSILIHGFPLRQDPHLDPAPTRHRRW